MLVNSELLSVSLKALYVYTTVSGGIAFLSNTLDRIALWTMREKSIFYFVAMC